MNALVLALDPATTATAMALFRGAELIGSHAEAHAEAELRRRVEQRGARVRAVREFLARFGVGRGALAAVVGRAGLLRPVEGGTYEVCDNLLRDAERAGDPSGLGAAVAHLIAAEWGCPAFVVDPESVDERETLARLAQDGCVAAPRAPALAIRAAVRRHARAVNRPLTAMRLVVAHLGETACVGAVRSGRMIDVAEVWQRPEDCARLCGVVPPTALADDESDPGPARAPSPLRVADVEEALERAERGDSRAGIVLQAAAYRIAKAVGGLATVLEGEVDAVLLTGRLAAAGPVIAEVCRRVEWIAPVFLYREEDQLLALAEGALRVLVGEEPAKRYG